MPSTSQFKLFSAAVALVLGLAPVSPPPASADNGAEFNERRRSNIAQPGAQSDWWSNDRRRQPRGEARQRQPFQGWWQWSQPQPGAFNPNNPPLGQARSVERDYEPEPAPVQGAEIFTYRPDPLVALGDADLKWRESAAPEPGDRLVEARRRVALKREPLAREVYDQLVARSSGVRVTEAQRKAVSAFYAGRDYAPVWYADGAPTDEARRVLRLLSNAANEGLEPRDYLPPNLGGFSDRVPEGASREAAARFELGLTAAALRYAMHASGGRILPNRLSGYHDLNPPTVNPAAALERLAATSDADAWLASLHPTHPAYAVLKAALAELEPEELRPRISIGDGPTIRPGAFDERIPDIRVRLAQLGDLAATTDPVTTASLETIVEPVEGEPMFGSAQLAGAMAPSEPATSQSSYYDEALESAVRVFQTRSGLRPDGLVGARTVSALNATGDVQRRRQVQFSMERLRWLPRDLGAKHVLVNQAAFTAAVIEDGRQIWETKVIVGKPNTQTAVFSDEIETVVLNPYWGVPGSIILHEMAPKSRRNPGYLDQEGYEVVNAQGQVVSSSSVDWSNVTRQRLNIGVRQPPGPRNALGEIKFLFPNKHAIYMHDTPSKHLFAKGVRMFSHGCVRVENPRLFAEILLGWDQDRLASGLASRPNQSVRLERKVPVHLAYFTAWPDAGGRIVYFNDVYGRDDRLEMAFGTTRVALQ